MLASERIRVNAVTPEPIGNATTARRADGARSGIEAPILLGAFGQPEHVAATIALLASPESAFTTGSTHDVSGGLRID